MFREDTKHGGVPKDAIPYFKMSEFVSSIKSHFNKKVDLILIDLRNFDKNQVTEVMDYINKNHAKDVDRLIILK